MRYLFIALLLAWLLPIQAIAGSETSAEATQEIAVVGYLYSADGDVEISADKQMTQAATKGAMLGNDTTVSTGEKSRAVLWFNDGQIIALQANTVFKILDYHYDPRKVEKSKLFFYLLKGGLRAIIGSIGRTHPAIFKLKTRYATVGIHGVDFMVALDDQLYLQATSGLIDIRNMAGTAALDAGQTAVVASANTLPTPIKADELHREIFSGLSEIPVPDPIPVENRQPSKLNVNPASAPAATNKPLWATHAEQPETDIDEPEVARAKARIRKELEEQEKPPTFTCSDFGWAPGTDAYDECIRNMGQKW